MELAVDTNQEEVRPPNAEEGSTSPHHSIKKKDSHEKRK